MFTVVETPGYLRDAERILSGSERAEVVNYLAANPKCGVALGGNLYKVRVALAGHGKRGGARLIYFYRDREMPIYALAIFAKNERDNITPSELRALIKAAN